MRKLFVIVTLAGIAAPASASPPGNISLTTEWLVASHFDFKGGFGIADPSGEWTFDPQWNPQAPSNPCNLMVNDVRAIQPASETWDVDQNIGTNLNGPAVGIGTLSPPLTPITSGWLAGSSGVNLGIPCPLPGSPANHLWLVWSGMNWHSAEHDSFAQLHLCTQQYIPATSPGCLAFPNYLEFTWDGVTVPVFRLWASACNGPGPGDGTFFRHDYGDWKGKYLAGIPFDTLAFKNDEILCPVRHSVDYSLTVMDFSPNQVSQTWWVINNQAVVPYGSGTTYMAICWQMPYVDLTNPLSFTIHVARAHDWKLIVDLLDLAAPGGTSKLAAATQLHYGGHQPGDYDNGFSTVALRGFYSQDATDAGQNGPGPCTQPARESWETFNKPAPTEQVPSPPGNEPKECHVAKSGSVVQTECDGAVDPPWCTTVVAGAITTVTCATGTCGSHPFPAYPDYANSHSVIATASLTTGTRASTDIRCGGASVLSGGTPATDTTPLPDPHAASKDGLAPPTGAYACVILFEGDGFGDCGLGGAACLSCSTGGGGPHRPPPPPPPESPPPSPSYGPGAPGHFSWTTETLTASFFDFKDGAGVVDPDDWSNPCTQVLYGWRATVGQQTWESDQAMGTNLNGPAIAISSLTPPLSPTDSWWFSNSGGIPLGMPCPLPGSSAAPLWLVWSGMNWRSAEADSFAQLVLCAHISFPSDNPGCMPVPDPGLRLWASACAGPLHTHDAFFGGDYTDRSGKYLGGQPWDTLRMKSDLLECPIRRSVDYTDTIQQFAAFEAAQGFDLIKNEAVVPLGSGTTYMALCWRMPYYDFGNPLNPVKRVAETHDWKLILDLNDFADSSRTDDVLAALQRHYGGAQPGDFDVGGPGAALRGFYSFDAGNPLDPDAGQNGPGPCTTPTLSWVSQTKKPVPLV